MSGNSSDNIPVRFMDITCRTKNVLTALGIHKKQDIYICFVVGNLPRVGTVVTHYPYADVELVYSKEVNEEIKSILQNDFAVETEELENVGL